MIRSGIVVVERVMVVLAIRGSHVSVLQVADQISRIPIRGAEHLSPDQLRTAIRQGARCVHFEYCLSLLVVTFQFRTAVYYTETWQERYLMGLPFSLLCLVLGPWGVPWGLYLTARCLWGNLTGQDDTDWVLENLSRTGSPDR